MKLKVLLIFFFLFSLSGCEKITGFFRREKEEAREIPVAPPKGPIVAKVNHIFITLEELNQEIDAYNRLIPEDRPEEKIIGREEKINYLKNEMVRRILLYQEALDRGLDRKEDILRILERTKQDLLVMELLRQETENIDVTSEEIRNYYNSAFFRERRREPEERHIREIIVPTEREAKDILIQLLQGRDFITLAKERSKALSAKDGGDLGFLKRGEKFPQFEHEAFSESLEVGKVTRYFRGPDGFYILKLEAKRGGRERTLSEMWDEIKRELIFLKQYERIESLITQLSREAKIEINEGEVK